MTCKAPFFNVQISTDGRVYPCCPYLISTNFGNVYETDNFNEIWNSKTAKDFRQECLNNTYKYCNLKICDPGNNRYQDNIVRYCDSNNLSIESEYPRVVKFCHDDHCNIKCITCRNDFITNSPQRTEYLNSKIESVYLPILKNARIVSFNGAGEALASKHGTTLIKTIAQKYPEIKFELHTNGILCDKQHLDNLGITDRLIGVDVSLHGLKKSTVEKIMIGTNYDKVIKNLKWLSSLKKEGKLKQLNLCFVINSINYKEMEDFLKFAISLDANVYFWEYRKWGTNIDKQYKKLAVFEYSHPEYNKFVKMIKKPIFQDKRCLMNQFLKDLQPLPWYKRLKHIFSITNEYSGNKKYKVITISGIKIKIKYA